MVIRLVMNLQSPAKTGAFVGEVNHDLHQSFVKYCGVLPFGPFGSFKMEQKPQISFAKSSS